MALLGQLTVGILGDLSGYSSSLTAAQKETLKFSKGIENMGKDISKIGYGFQDLGQGLTNKITKPALVAGAAVTGMVATLGFKRLVGMDNAQAKLKGLGYEGEHLERVMGDVKEATKVGMTTAAEGADIAAGALAAGVKEGDELQKYIRLVGDAAIGSNRPVDEMAQIFNRVQGAGKIMTQELNQIEHGMPGFSIALAKHLGVAPEKMREMVTAGEVTSKDFLTVMDDFAGGMAEAYSDTWQGMVKNTLAYIGIIGEALLDGLFEDGKKAIAQFIEVLQSEQLHNWATETGAKISQFAQTVGEKAMQMKEWWDSLSDSTQNFMKKFALFGSIGAVAIGPVLLVVGKLIVGVGNLITRFGAITAAVTKLGGVFGVLTGPIGITIGIIASLIAIGVLLIKNWDTVKEKAQSVFSMFGPLLETVKRSFSGLLDSVRPTMDNLANLWQSLLPILEKVGVVVGAVLVTAFGVLVSVLNGVLRAIAPITNAIINFVDIVVNMVNVVVALLTGDFAGAWQYLQDAGQSTIDFFVNMVNGILDLIVGFVEGIISFFHGLYMALVGNSIIPDMVNAIVEWFQNLFQWLFDIVESIVNAVVTGFNHMKKLVQNYTTMIVDIVKAGWEFIKEYMSIILDMLIALVTGDFGSMRDITGRLMNAIKSLISNIWSAIDSFLSKTLGNMWTNVKNKFTDIKNNVQKRTKEAKDKLTENFGNMVSSVKKKVGEIVGTVSEKFKEVKDKITKPIKDAKDLISGYIDDIKGFFSNLKLKIPTPELPKLPTFTTTGGSGIIPKIGVKWNAMGGIFKRPTIFNTASAGLQGVGEAGAEAIIPLKPKVLAGIGEGISQTMNHVDAEELSLLRQQVDILTKLLDSSKNIESKPVLTEGDIKRSYDKMDGKESTKHDIFTGRAGGVY